MCRPFVHFTGLKFFFAALNPLAISLFPQIKDDLYGNVREDISLDGYRKHVISAEAPGPLSREEQGRNSKE